MSTVTLFLIKPLTRLKDLIVRGVTDHPPVASEMLHEFAQAVQLHSLTVRSRMKMLVDLSRLPSSLEHLDADSPIASAKFNLPNLTSLIAGFQSVPAKLHHLCALQKVSLDVDRLNAASSKVLSHELALLSSLKVHP